MPLDKAPFTIKQFKGKLVSDIDVAFGKYAQSETPFDYALDSINLEYLKKGGIRTRKGLQDYVHLATTIVGKPVQFWEIKLLNGVAQTDRYLVLAWDGTDGRMYDTGVTVPATNPILTILGMKYAYVINAFGRMYITPWSDFAAPLTSEVVRVYNGLYNTRSTKSPSPVVGTFAVAPAAGGFVTAGVHLVSVLFETDTGYISTGPVAHVFSGTPLLVTTTTANATINGTNVPVGPAGSGVIKRHIIITKVVVNNNGLGFASYEPFIALTINDNTTTTFSFTKPDSALVDSAAGFLGSSAANSNIPSCISLATFKNRMVYIGPRPSGSIESSILISDTDVPEQVDTSTNLTGSPVLLTTESTIAIGQDFSGNPNIATELGGVLYVFKNSSTFGIIDNVDASPSEWDKPKLVDAAKGASPFGITNTGNNPSALIDGNLIVAGPAGIYTFNGSFAQQSLADGIWEEYAPDDLKWIKLVNDPIRKLLFMRIGDPSIDVLSDTVTLNDFILTANYYYGSDISTMRWGAYKYKTYQDRQIYAYDILLRAPGTQGNAISNFFKLNYPLLTILHFKDPAATTDLYIVSESERLYDFNLGKIDWSYETGYTPNKQGEDYTFGPLKLRANSVPISLPANTISVYKGLIDDANYTLIGPLDPELAPKKYMSLTLNEIAEHLRIKLSSSDYALIQELTVFATQRGVERPR